MKRTVKYLSLTVALAVAGYASAFNESVKSKSGVVQKPAINTRGANCAPAQTSRTMTFNAVNARLETGGLLFLNRAIDRGDYRVPQASNIVVIYAGSLWMGGVDVNGQLKIAAVKFRNTGNDFWPGPLTVNLGTGNFDPGEVQGDAALRDYGPAGIDPAECLFYDKIFTIRKSEVITFVTDWECNNIQPEPPGCDDPTAPSNEVLSRIYAWPGNGDPTKFQDPFLAPFYDRDQDGIYDPMGDGDYPWYDDILGNDDIQCGKDRRVSLFGDETHWWVFNDRGNIHTESGGDAIGMEIRAQAFAFATDDEINQMTFYNYELINRGTQTLFDTYFAQYIDADIGGPFDDYVGCDVTRGLGYAYNGDASDNTATVPGYGQNPPAIGVDFFEGPYQDADGLDNPGPYIDPTTGQLVTPSVLTAIAQKGIVYSGLGIGYSDSIVDNERFGMRGFNYFTSGQTPPPPSQQDPETGAQYYNYMRGKWRFGDNLVYGGSGFPGSPGSTTILSNYMFPGDSDPLDWATGGTDPGFTWAENEPGGPGSSGNNPNDRRFVQAAGPFTLRPGAVNNITVGIVFARSYEGDIFASVRALKRADTKAQALFDNCFRILEPPQAPELTIKELNNELILLLDNPLSSNNYQEQYIEEDKVNIIDPDDGSGTVYDKFYRFEGYQIFQMLNAEATVTDVNDPTKARLVAQCDIQNQHARLINFEFDEALGFSVPDEKVNGENKGIRHTFRITEDAFASGSRTLVNHKTYYYIAVAYGVNNYLTYNPNDAGALNGQKLPYLRSRLNAQRQPIAAQAAVPHDPRVERGGTVINTAYGQTPRITRLDGAGNGNRSLELTAASENQIVATGFMQNPEYEYGGGPINVKVVDPLNLVGGQFKCKFTNYPVNTTNNPDADAIDSASWIIERYVNGVLTGSVASDRTIKQGNEQIIAEWGISVEIMQNAYTKLGTGSPDREYTTPIESSVTHSDSSKRWLRFVQDDDAFFPTNWVRDGNFVPAETDNCNPLPDDYLSPCCYSDNTNQVPDGLFGTLLGGGIAPHKIVGYECDYMPLAYPYVQFNSAKIKSRISYAPSIDIVITKDTSKWTRCVVIELGRDAALNQGGQQPGKLRASQSVDKEGNPDGSGTFGMSWFPGYAIDLETGARLHMAFGENSFLGGHNGADMKWNPTSTDVDNNGVPVFGGQHPIWIYGYNVGNTGTPAYDGVNNWVYDRYMAATNAEYARAVTSLVWVANVLTAEDHTYLESDVKIRVRVNKEYRDFVATGQNNGRPMYSWNMDEISTQTGSQEQLASVLDLINVVPNPYYAFSEYERNRLDNRVKITNLPDQCTVTIYNVSGKLIRTYKKDNDVTSIDWDLKNFRGIPIASGVYIIHVEVPGVGEKIVKFFGGMRQVDLENL